jgi:hypothetical protein
MVTGLVLLVVPPTVSCCLGALAKPVPPYYDIDRQQADFARLADTLLAVNCVALVAAWLLVAYGRRHVAAVTS